MVQVKRLKEEIITRKQIENDLTTANQHLIGLLDIWETGIIILDHRHIVQFINQRAEALLGYRHNEVVSRPVDSILSLPDLSSDQLGNGQTTVVTATRQDQSTVPIDVAIAPIKVDGDMAYALLCQDTSKQREINRKIDVAEELTRTHQKMQVMQSVFDSVLKFMNQEGKHALTELRNIESTMEDVFVQMSHTDVEHLYRKTIVELMTTSLEAWFHATGKDKVQFAEESGIWRAYLDVGTYKTRTLDKYLDIEKLPKNPRWKDVVKSVEFALSICSESNPLTTRLKASLSKLHALINAR